MGNQDVDVRKEAPSCGRQPREQVGRALQEHDVDSGPGQRIEHVRDLAANGFFLRARNDKRRFEMRARSLRDLLERSQVLEPCGEAREKVRTARLANELFPLRQRPARDLLRTAQRQADEIFPRHSHALAASLSQASTACASSLEVSS